MTAHPAINGAPIAADRALIEHFLRDYIGSAIHLVAIEPDGRAAGRWFARDAAAATAWAVRQNDAGKGIYFTVNECRPDVNKKCSRADITAQRFLHVDIDPPKDGTAFDIEAAAAALAALPLEPSFVIASGGGLGAFWRLADAVSDQTACTDANKALEALLGGDHCHNVDRVMRLPGTVNWPNKKKREAGRVPVVSTILESDVGLCHRFEELVAAFPSAQKPQAEDIRTSKPIGPDDVVWLTADDLMLSRFDPLRSLIEHPDGRDRSRDALACAGEMARAGYSDAQILGVLMNPANAVHDHIGAQRDPRYQASRCLAQVRRDHPAAQQETIPAFKHGISAAALLAKTFEPVNYVVPGLLAEGATLFAGAPKIGKSWMAYDYGIAVASGRPAFGAIPVTQGDVLYLALEDNERRLKSRLLKKGVSAPERLTLVTDWPGLDDGCIAEIEAWASSVARPTLVIVDVLKMVRGRTRNNEGVYDADYRALSGLAKFARDRGIAILIVHHTRKMSSDDPLESISGTNGLTGASDTVMVLKRDNGTGNCILYVRGRDVEESETAVRFNRDNGTWQVLGAAEEVGRSNERQAILEVLHANSKPLNAREISDILGKSYDAVRKTLTRMAHADEIGKAGRGTYTCPNGPNVPNNGTRDTCDTWDRGYELGAASGSTEGGL
jgi:hypothetical protein